MARAAALAACLFLAAAPLAAQHDGERALAIAPGGVSLAGGDLHLTLSLTGPPGAAPEEVRVLVDGLEVHREALEVGEHSIRVPDAAPDAGRHTVVVEAAGLRTESQVRVIPGWLSIVPPLVAIGLALLFKDVLISLFVGVFTGGLILYAWNPLTAFARSIDTFVAPALAESSHARILIFSTLLGGMVGIISKSGGTRGIVERLTGFASSTRRGQLASWAMGVAIFFDDYANTLIVGSTMRPITDRLRISREKLAYIVDSTAAPVASIVPISTWIGFEIGLISSSFAALGLHFNPYVTFIDTIPFRFYPLFALVLGFTIAATDRDFGPMYRAEQRAMTKGQLLAEGAQPLADYTRDTLEPPPGIPHRAINAVLPILTVVVVTIAGLYSSGAALVDPATAPTETVAWLREVFSKSDPYNSLLWASLAGVAVAILLPLVQRLLSLKAAIEGMVEGFKSMFLALIVLILAWSISSLCTELHTADFLVGIAQGHISPYLLPVLVFALSAAASFATGTSWGTMGILVPLVIPIAHGLSTSHGLDPESQEYYTLMLGTISSVLAGSVWGDHCSPISDTTILSSMASGCDHIAHVRTQIPYALGIGVLGMVVGDIPTAYGLSPWISLAVGTAVIIGGVLWLGKKVTPPPKVAPAQAADATGAS